MASALGAPASWLVTLKTLVGVMLTAKQPMFVVWGRSRSLVYNDAYVDVLGSKHPAALGRPFLDVWDEARTDLEPPRRPGVRWRVGAHGRHHAVPPARDDRPDEAHFSFSYSPVHDGDGAVVGLFCPCTETTAQVRAEHAIAAARVEAERAMRVAEEAKLSREDRMRLRGADQVLTKHTTTLRDLGRGLRSLALPG